MPGADGSPLHVYYMCVILSLRMLYLRLCLLNLLQILLHDFSNITTKDFGLSKLSLKVMSTNTNILHLISGKSGVYIFSHFYH